MFSYLRLSKVYFKRHYKKISGCPDICLPSKKKAVFIDGDFWHGWKFKETEKRLPDSYWREKIQSNIKRDSKNRFLLKKQGWSVLRVWEHDLEKNPEKTLGKIKEFLEN